MASPWGIIVGGASEPKTSGRPGISPIIMGFPVLIEAMLIAVNIVGMFWDGEHRSQVRLVQQSNIPHNRATRHLA